MLCAFSTILKNLIRNKNGTSCASFRNLPVLESRCCHFLVTWSWTSHKTSQYWPQESGEKTRREHLPGMLRGSVMLWTGQSPPRQTAVITTTECLSNPVWSPLESLWKFDTWGYNNSSPQEEERLLSFPGKGSATEKPWLKEPSQPPLPLYKSALQPWHFVDLHLALHKCKPQTAILCWFWINPFLLEKYLTLCLFGSTEGREST